MIHSTNTRNVVTAFALLIFFMGVIFTSCQKSSTLPSALVPEAKSEGFDAVTGNHLIGFWKFNGDTKDASGKGNDGELMRGHPYFGAGIPVLTADRFGRSDMAYHFDHGGNVEVPYTSALNPKEMTISLWSKKDTAGRTINTDFYCLTSLNRWYGYKLQYQSQNKIFYTVRAIEGLDTVFYDRDDETAVLNNETWYHVAVTFKPGVMNFYINGNLVKSWTNVPGIPVTVPSSVNFIIGQDLPTSLYSFDISNRYYVGYGGFFTGDIDDVMFFNTALSTQQIKLIYTHQNTP
ncbi:MAG: LamG domain-containing protein [Chitinophagales bacterium]|nr:LamG domain-containing protein [Chitinophagales bacterium]